MSWLQRIAQTYEDTSYWGRSYLQNNPDAVNDFEVYQSPHFPHVFLGGEDDLDEAAEKAGQPICKIIDCRDLPEVDAEHPSWDYGFYSTVKAEFDKKVAHLARTIQTTDCPIYVHCALGANRSVSVLAAAISLLTNQPIDTILADMKKSRTVVNPQDPYYLMALEQNPSESPEFKERRHLELDQDFPLVQPGLPKVSSDDMIGNLELIDEERQWRRAVTTPGFPVIHNDGWSGTVIESFGDPVNGGKVLVDADGKPVQVSALELSPAMKTPSPFKGALAPNWLQKMAEQKTLIISRGPSGSGKSRMNHDLKEEFNAPVFGSDDFFMQSGTYQFDPSQLVHAHEWNRQRVEESMRGQTPVIIVDNTNTQFWEMKPYVQLAQQYGYAVDFKEPEWNPDLKTPEGVWNVDFLESMQDQPDREKNVPRRALEQMVSQYQYNPSVEAVLQSERPGR